LGFTGVLRLVIRLTMDRRVPLGLKLIIPLAIVYVISPIDLVPDFAPFALGRIDDLVVALLAVAMFLALAPRDVVLEHIRGRRQGGDAEDDARRSKENVIEGSYRYVDEDKKPDR
jgi:uncharacterized membrane protein YkvA (DUF1232 family)